jgi:transaldolase
MATHEQEQQKTSTKDGVRASKAEPTTRRSASKPRANPLLELQEHGQSYWLDNLTREALRSGTLRRRVEREDLRGVTSNPKTFFDSVQKDPTLYRDELAQLATAGATKQELYERLAVSDVREACDVLRPVYDSSEGNDGFVSLEVSPELAHDSLGSIEQAKSLAAQVDRPNLMVKIPGTKAGISAVERLLYDGIHVNITLLFSVERYAEFAQAYLRALEQRRRDGRAIDEIRSVASFFLSRIDVLVDPLLEQRASGAPEASALLGKTAIACAKLAYQRFLSDTGSERWRALADAGAQPQRLLWASTGSKNPRYRDVVYVEPLIGPATVSTMPEKTIAAFADHGIVEDTLEQGVDGAREVLASLERLGIDFEHVASELENEGIRKFIEPYRKLLDYLEGERRAARQAQG